VLRFLIGGGEVGDVGNVGVGGGGMLCLLSWRKE